APLTPLLYTLSLHDALPISLFIYVVLIPFNSFKLNITDLSNLNFIIQPSLYQRRSCGAILRHCDIWESIKHFMRYIPRDILFIRSEEHTSELQSREKLVCRL